MLEEELELELLAVDVELLDELDVLVVPVVGGVLVDPLPPPPQETMGNNKLAQSNFFNIMFSRYFCILVN